MSHCHQRPDQTLVGVGRQGRQPFRGQPAKIMTSSLFTNGGYKLDSGKADLAKSQTGTPTELFPSLRRESCDYVHSLPPTTVLGNIHNSSPHSLQGKAKVPSQGQVVACRPGQHPGSGEGQEENWGSVGIQSTALRSMGGDSGSPVKSKTLLGHNNNNMGKMDPTALNANKHPRDSVVGDGEVKGGVVAAVVGGPQAPGLSQEGKRGGLRKGASHSQAQSSCIRQILLLQLELIEQQQQQLHNKSKEIDDLKAEKEMLLARIERMEHRLQLGKRDAGGENLAAQRAPRPTPVHTPHREDRGSPPKTPESQGSAGFEGRGSGSSPRTLHFGRGGKGHKRRFLFQDPRSAKRRAQAKSLQKEALVPKEEPAERGGEEEVSPRTSPNSPQFEELSYLSTTDMYLCCWHQPPPSPWREPSPKKEESVAIPSWRENIMDPLNEDEATDIPENLEDNVFLKRHSKHELDEKRRKRWDIQRIREQRMFQRLQQRMNRRKGIQESEPEVLSFYPEAEDVEALIITPHLPVVAFGRPLPKLTRRNFDLPWLDERSRCRMEVPKKQTPHRTCRK